MKFTKLHLLGLIFAALLIAGGIVFFFTKEDKNLFIFMIGLSIAVATLPFIVGVVSQTKREEQINQMFLEFSRNLAESVSTGTPISKSVVNMSRKNYGVLSPYIIKLANQISVGIPLSRALETFAQDVNNPVISRAVELMSEAEKAGGEIESILESVAKSIAEIEKLRSERRSAIASLIVQGYIIFFIFIGIMLIMQFKILPLAVQVNEIPGINQAANTESSASGVSENNLANLFLYLLITQGFFAGFAIGKLAEGNLRAGIKHSFILTISAVLIATGVRALI